MFYYTRRINCTACVYGSYDPSCEVCQGNHYIDILVPRPDYSEPECTNTEDFLSGNNTGCDRDDCPRHNGTYN